MWQAAAQGQAYGVMPEGYEQQYAEGYEQQQYAEGYEGQQYAEGYEGQEGCACSAPAHDRGHRMLSSLRRCLWQVRAAAVRRGLRGAGAAVRRGLRGAGGAGGAGGLRGRGARGAMSGGHDVQRASRRGERGESRRTAGSLPPE